MSFSSNTKDALARVPFESECCKIAELSAFLHLSGNINICGKNKRNITITTESQVVARRVYNIVKDVYKTSSELTMSENNRLNKRHVFYITVSDPDVSDRILSDTGILKQADGYAMLDLALDRNLIKDECCKGAMLRAIFLAVGSISNPEKFYHMEFTMRNTEYANGLQQLIAELGINARVTQRKDNDVVYIKGADQISDLLAHIGAFDAVLALENIRVLKDVRNNVNRAVNCENANVDKTLAAAAKQTDNILYIRENLGLDRLPQQLAQVAELRLSNPYAPLSELSAMMDGDVGKSGLNHRFKKLEKIANDLRAEKGEI